MKILAVDAQYDEDEGTAKVGGVLFDHWDAAEAVAETAITVSSIAPYEPGKFYKRELPCIRRLMAGLHTKPDVVIVDSFVDLGPERPGLGRYLFDDLGGMTPVVGVAKTGFRNAQPAEVHRGRSKKPLFVTAAGMPLGDAVRGVLAMHGEHRVPTLLKRVDHLARGLAKPVR